jgi:hypothetical protein
LAFFAQFVRVLNDVDDPDADRENRLGWACASLAEFADAMGPDFLDAANIDGRLDWFSEESGMGCFLPRIGPWECSKECVFESRSRCLPGAEDICCCRQVAP